MEQDEKMITGKSKISLPRNNIGGDTIYVWNYQPTHERFLCSGCGKEAVKFIEVE